MSDADDSPDDDTPEFRSPKRCLARSFRLSRDRWKLKASQRRQQIKALQVKARDLEVSRDLWKAKALHLEAQLAERLGVVPPPEEGEPTLGQAPDHGRPADHAPQAAPPGDCQTPPAGTASPHDPQEVPPPKKARRARR